MEGGREETEEEGWLGTATKVAGLIAGAVAATYVLGGLIIALRLLFEGFSVGSAVTLLGQLPRELVMTTALLEALSPAAIVGVTAALVFGAVDGPRKRRPVPDGKTDEEADRLLTQPRRKRTLALLCTISLVLMIPAFLQAVDASGLSEVLLLGAVVYAFLVTFALAAAGWYLIRRSARRGLSRLPAAALGGVIWAGMAVIPATMFAGGLEFERAQACTTDSPIAVEGLLVGETSDHLLLATDFEDEESVLSLPAERVTKSEYGDLTSEFICDAPSAETTVEASAAIGEHGSEAEQELAAKLRPWLRFDGDERWRPLEVGAFVAERFADGKGHGGCAADADPPCGDIAELGDLGSDVGFIDIHGHRPNGADFGTPSDCARPSPVLDCADGEDSVMYYRRTSHGGHWYWDYWWFFRYNDYTGQVNDCEIICGDHEGDWEGITVITTPSTDPEILGAIYATHKARLSIDPALLPVVGTHPLVFVAEGTHASYPFRCASECDQYLPLPGFTQTRLPDETHDGAVRWAHDSDASCDEIDCVRPLPEADSTGADSLPFAGAWAAWSGAWGETCHEGCSGRREGFESSPHSPGRQTRYQCPWVPTLLARPGARDDTRTNSRKVGDVKRQLAACEAQRGGL